ncbi:MAG: response regulator RpfG family c-di-GMP phosphodiesterase [Hyphomicrobiaceae bacterium]|jgi:response regulator RpfG family c-di-GMP phosphodiesterase
MTTTKSPAAPRPRILLIDDDANVLQGLARVHGRKFDITTVQKPIEAIQLVQKDPDFAVVICDYQMPGIKGAACLAKIQSIAPDIVRVLLTGNNDLNTAVDAINRGAIFRFLQKPCDIETFERCVRDSVQQNELQSVERELLENTLKGAVEVMSEILSLSQPTAFGKAGRIQHYIKKILAKTKCDQAWQVETAGLLFQIGLVAVPQEVIQAANSGDKMSVEHRAIYGRHPTIGADLLSNIPRLEKVAEIVRYQAKNFDGVGMPTDSRAGTDIPLGARILHAVIEFDARLTRGQSQATAIAEMASTAGKFDPSVVADLATIEPETADMQSETVSIRRLVAGHLLDQDILHSCGSLIVPKGQRVTESMLARLRGYADLGHIDREIKVLAPDEPVSV